VIDERSLPAVNIEDSCAEPPCRPCMQVHPIGIIVIYSLTTGGARTK
jgi:hypothetical protein